MPFFPGKTPHELLQIFRAMPLHRLEELNRAYGPHFIHIETRLDEENAKIETYQQQLNPLQAKYKALELEIEADKRRRSEALSNLPGNGAERHLQYPMSFSSSESQQTQLSIKIRTIQTQLSMSEDIIDYLEKEKRESIDELKKLNAVLDQKHQELSLDAPTEGSSLNL